MEKIIEKAVEDFEQGNVSRRAFVGSLTAIVALVAETKGQDISTTSSQIKGKHTFEAIELNHLALNVKDLDESQKFYEKYLGLKLIRQIPNFRFMGFGTHFIALIKSSESRPVGMDHVCFTLENYDQKAVVEKLKLEGLKPQTEFERTYFNDPNGIRLQIAYDDYPVKGGRPNLTRDLRSKIYK